jgi:ATP-binding cassette, subfamily B, bacterial
MTKELPPISSSTVNFWDVFRFAASLWREQPVRLSIVLVMVITAALLETYLPTTLSAFLGHIRQGADAGTIYRALGLFLGTYFAFVTLFHGAYFIYNVFETRIFKTLFDRSFAHVHRLSEQFFVNTFTGSIISKINRARSKIENFEDQILHRFLSTFVILVGSIGFLALRFPGLALLLAIYIVILGAVSLSLVLRVAGPAQAAYAEAEDVFGAHLADSIAGIVTTRAFAQEKREISEFYARTESLRYKNSRAYLLGNGVGLIQQLLLGGMLALLLGGGTWLFLRGQATIEDMAYLTLAYTIIQSYVREIGENVKSILTASYDLHAGIRLLREVPDIQDAPGAKPLDIRQGEITFDRVCFTYPGKPQPLFSDFSVRIRPGERIALVGHSGSGKTSFVRLVQRLYDIRAGRILIDGQDIAGGTQESLRGAIALVPQDPILFHRSLAENIAYGKPDASLDEIRKAARQAHIDDFIMGLPEGYDTLVGERGIKLSGGERQRVAIARALLANRPILILDEATSSLDSASERAIQDALQVLTHGRTSIMVAHRLSTILDADRILVFDQGRIVEEGTHDQLIQRENGIYAGFFQLQSGGFIGE